MKKEFLINRVKQINNCFRLEFDQGEICVSETLCKTKCVVPRVGDKITLRLLESYKTGKIANKNVSGIVINEVILS